jgi:site-specific recombinase XerC
VGGGRGCAGRRPDGQHEPPPQIPGEPPPPVLTDDELCRLLKACEGRDFTDRRDGAIPRLFLDTGLQVSEAAGIMLPGPEGALRAGEPGQVILAA